MNVNHTFPNIREKKKKTSLVMFIAFSPSSPALSFLRLTVLNQCVCFFLISDKLNA